MQRNIKDSSWTVPITDVLSVDDKSNTVVPRMGLLLYTVNKDLLVSGVVTFWRNRGRKRSDSRFGAQILSGFNLNSWVVNDVILVYVSIFVIAILLGTSFLKCNLYQSI